MTRICPNCFYLARDSSYSQLPKVEEIKFKGSLLVGGFVIGLGLMLIGLSIFGIRNFQDIKYYLTLVSGIVIIALGIISLKKYFEKVSKVCPRCKYDNMPASHEPEGQKIIQEKGFVIKDDSTHICTNCGHKSEHKIQNRRNSIFVIIIGILTILLTIVMNPLAILGSFVIIGTGIYALRKSSKKAIKCTNCNNITSIPKNSPEAKALIEETQP